MPPFLKIWLEAQPPSLQKGRGAHYDRHLGITRVITAENSPLHIATSRTRTENLWFPSASRLPLRHC